MKPSPILVEVCVESFSGALIAHQSGAARIELNSAIELGGLTPTINLLNQIKSAIPIAVICMVRPRAGNFFYSDPEFELMQQEASALIEAGADGLAFGILKDNQTIDLARCRNISEICGDREKVFHRAFDCTAELNTAMHDLIDLKIDRVLTSGGAPTALEGAAMISELVQEFGEEIQILPGSGVRPENAVPILQQTGCRQIHGTFRSIRPTGVTVSSRINFHGESDLGADAIRLTDGEQVRKTVDAVSAAWARIGRSP